jgi:hypothetical protein
MVLILFGNRLVVMIVLFGHGLLGETGGRIASLDLVPVL